MSSPPLLQMELQVRTLCVKFIKSEVKFVKFLIKFLQMDEKLKKYIIFLQQLRLKSLNLQVKLL
jgi:hypothetical protein